MALELKALSQSILNQEENSKPSPNYHLKSNSFYQLLVSIKNQKHNIIQLLSLLPLVKHLSLQLIKTS
jgi:hypothetical protein